MTDPHVYIDSAGETALLLGTLCNDLFLVAARIAAVGYVRSIWLTPPGTSRDTLRRGAVNPDDMTLVYAAPGDTTTAAQALGVWTTDASWPLYGRLYFKFLESLLGYD